MGCIPLQVLMIEIEAVMSELQNKRPVFQSEADFQHAFAWEIHRIWLTSEIRLENKPQHVGGRIYLDIWAYGKESGTLAIELKYKTKKMSVTAGEETFELTDQSAQDHGRYDFLKDIQRLEQVTGGHDNITGYAVLLTNDRSYWEAPVNENTADAQLRLHDGRTITGQLAWGAGASAETTKGREAPIVLKGNYKLTWHNYSLLNDGGSYNQFRYLAGRVADIYR